MTDREPARRTTRPIPAMVGGGPIVAAAALGAAAFHGYPSRSSASWTAAASPLAESPIDHLRSWAPAAPGELGAAVPAGATARAAERSGAPGSADGVPAGVTVFDSPYPALSRLDLALHSALRRAATDAAGAGVTFYVDSGCPPMHADPTQNPGMQR